MSGGKKAASTSMGLATIAINMATLGAQDKIAFAAKKGSITTELPREAVKIKVANGAAMAARAGTMERVSQRLAVEWEQELWKGLREEGLEREGR